MGLLLFGAVPLRGSFWDQYGLSFGLLFEYVCFLYASVHFKC